MTANIIFGSPNALGTIDDEQLQTMLDRFNLGILQSSRQTPLGALGQTLFVVTTEGEFVLKGNPVYPGQLQEEKFFVEQLSEKTNLTVPTPYLIDDTTDIFGWSYAVMPRLEGDHLHEEHLQARLDSDAHLHITDTIAATLKQFHQWKVSDFGELNTETFEVTPFATPYKDWLFSRILYWLEDAKKYSHISSRDRAWTERLLADSETSFQRGISPTFVMGDFKTGNFLIKKRRTEWVISGVFDFTNAYFADPASDLIKMLIYYMDHLPEGAWHLVNTYFQQTEEREGAIERLKIHMLHQRILDWGSAKATKNVPWDDGLSFSQWATHYITELEKLFD